MLIDVVAERRAIFPRFRPVPVDVIEAAHLLSTHAKYPQMRTAPLPPTSPCADRERTGTARGKKWRKRHKLTAPAPCTDPAQKGPFHPAGCPIFCPCPAAGGPESPRCRFQEWKIRPCPRPRARNCRCLSFPRSPIYAYTCVCVHASYI